MLPPFLIEEARRQRGVLEAMFADVALEALRARHPNHPAVEQFDYLSTIMAKGLAFPDEVAALRALINGLLDQTLWASPASATDYWDFIPNAGARERIKTSIARPDQFHDSLAEVFVWAWIRERVSDAALVEEVGLPDIVAHRSTSEETWIEVKRLRLGKNPTRVREVIDKANRQIKRATPESGGVVVLYAERPVQRAALDDRIPSDIQPYVDQIKRRLNSDVSRSAARVVLVWDDFLIETDPTVGLTYTIRRRSVTVSHRNPRSRAALPEEATTVRQEAAVSVAWPKDADGETSGHGPRLRLGRISVGPRFREFNAGLDGIRPQHAIEALNNPDGAFKHHFRFAPELYQSLITKRVTASKVPYTMLLVVQALADGREEIGEAYRLYDQCPEGAQGSQHPMAAFQELITRYSLPFTFPTPLGRVRVNFLRAARFVVNRRDQQAIFESLGFSPNPQALSGTALHRFVGDSPIICELEWLWFLDLPKYRSDIRTRVR